MHTRPNMPPSNVPKTRPRPVLIEEPSKSDITNEAAMKAQMNCGDRSRIQGIHASSESIAMQIVFFIASFHNLDDGHDQNWMSLSPMEGPCEGLLWFGMKDAMLPCSAKAPVHSERRLKKKCRAMRRAWCRWRSSRDDGGSYNEPPWYNTSLRAFSHAPSSSAPRSHTAAISSSATGLSSCSASTMSSVAAAMALMDSRQADSVIPRNFSWTPPTSFCVLRSVSAIARKIANCSSKNLTRLQSRWLAEGQGSSS
mmetsp:Transcript_118474/g.330501  ORF Transcript_118474/g.330501 Transcript_118474/m.330501 type:complete len:254 (+) Transcript_118474:1147-1908(+)